MPRVHFQSEKLEELELEGNFGAPEVTSKQLSVHFSPNPEIFLYSLFWKHI